MAVMQVEEVEYLKDGLMRVSIGPQHPISGQGRILVLTDGETIYEIEIDIGYSHRGIEKILENRLYIHGIVPLERMVMLDTSPIAMCYVRAIEDLYGVEAPKRAQYIRTIILEMNRIISHTYALGLFAESAAWNPAIFLWTTADREPFLDLLEMLTGARWSYSFIVPGGVRADIPQGFKEAAMEAIKFFRDRLDVYVDSWIDNYLFEMRTRDVGVIPEDKAIEWGAAGPSLRASGVAYDTRKDDPYAAYEELDFKIVTDTAGDSYARGGVRVKEMYVSLDIIEQALENMPDGPIKRSLPQRVPKGETYARVETARGEIGMYVVSDGSDKPYRVKISPASFRNIFLIEMLPTIEELRFADVPVIFYSLDPWFLDADR
jgi:NADH-quinone oxidoreductase subunit D